MFIGSISVVQKLVCHDFLGAGGGGASATASAEDVKYPNHMQTIHHALLSGGLETVDAAVSAFPFNVAKDIKDARDNSPFAGVTAFSPDTAIEAIQADHDTLEDAVNAVDPDGDIEAWFAAAAAKWDTVVTDGLTDEINTMVNAHETRTDAAFQREVSNVASGLFDIRAVAGTQFSLEIAAMEADRQARLDEVGARMELGVLTDAQGRRAQAVLSLAQAMQRHFQTKLEGQRMVFLGQFDIGKTQFVAKQDELEWNTSMGAKNRLWNLELYPYFGNTLAGIAGASTVPRAQTKGERLVGALTNSLSMGFQVGGSMGVEAGVGIGLGNFALNAAQILTGW